MSKDKKKKLQGFDKAVLKRVLTHIKKYRILVILSFVCAMILHNPEVKEQLEACGIPVIVEHSSYETDPLGRLEWVKFYGALFDAEDAAEQLFETETCYI